MAQKIMSVSDNPTVSVLVCTYDRPEYLARCLASIEVQSYGNFELVVVQGPAFFGTTEATDAVLARYEGRIKLARVDAHNVAMARNKSLSLAAGEIIALIDDDAVAAPNWLHAFVTAYRQRPLAGFGGFARSETGGIASRVVTCDRLGTPFEYPTEAAACCPQSIGAARCYSLTGYNASFIRQAVVDVGGFDETFAYMLEETDLCFALMDHGFQLGFAPNAWVVHGAAPGIDRHKDKSPRNLYRSYMSLAYFCRKHGKSQAQEHLQRRRDTDLRKIESLAAGQRLSEQEAALFVDQIESGLRDGWGWSNNRRLDQETTPPPDFKLFARGGSHENMSP